MRNVRARVAASAKLFALNFVSFFVVTVNFRAVAQANYLATFVSDIFLCLLGFTIIKKIAEAESLGERVSYAIGGALGAQLSILFTKVLFGQ